MVALLLISFAINATFAERAEPLCICHAYAVHPAFSLRQIPLLEG